MLAFLLSLWGTPRAAEAARRYGIVDQPDTKLKTHGEPVAYLGGLSVYLSFLVTFGLVFDYDSQILGLLLAGSLVVLLGLLDDLGAITPKVKFIGQLVAAFVLVRSDITIQLVYLEDWQNIALTMFWIVGMMNAFNIIDIMDGLAAGTAFVASAIFLAIAVIQGEAWMAFITATLCGSLLGFLRTNYHPAKIYLGDSGSMFIGMVLGSLALVTDYTRTNQLGFVAPLFILCIPLFDTAYVMILRFFKGKPIYHGSPDHFALRLRKKVKSVPYVVNISCSVGLLFGALGIWVSKATPTTTLWAAGGVFVFFVVAGFWLATVKMDTLSE